MDAISEVVNLNKGDNYILRITDSLLFKRVFGKSKNGLLFANTLLSLSHRIFFDTTDFFALTSKERLLYSWRVLTRAASKSDWNKIRYALEYLERLKFIERIYDKQVRDQIIESYGRWKGYIKSTSIERLKKEYDIVLKATGLAVYMAFSKTMQYHYIHEPRLAKLWDSINRSFIFSLVYDKTDIITAISNAIYSHSEELIDRSTSLKAIANFITLHYRSDTTQATP